MSIIETVKDVLTRRKAPVQMPPPTTQPPGTIGGTQIVQTPPSIKQPKRIHATVPTVLIHGKEPEIKEEVKVLRDPKLAEVKESLAKADIKVSQIQKEATLPQKIELSKPSQSILEVSQKGAEAFRTAGERVSQIDSPLLHPINVRIGETLLESGARTVEMAGMIPAGAETLARHPELAKPALAVGLYGSTIGVGKALKEDPLQTLSDIAVAGVLFKGAGVAAPKPKIPFTIARKATIPEGVLLKGEIKAPKVDAKPPTTTAVTEFKPPTVETFIGKVKGETAELFVKVPESEMSFLSRITSEKAPKQIMTGEGKFTVIEQPTMLDVIPATKLKLAGEPKLTLREQLAAKVPFEVIRKVDITPVKLETTIVPERVQIPEFLRTIDVTPSQARPTSFEFADTIKTRGLLEKGRTSEFKDFTEQFRRKDIQEIPYTRDISIGIGEESALLGRVLSKQERGLVRDTIIKERIEFEPVKTQYKPPKTDFRTVGSVTGQQQIIKTKTAPTTFKEPSTIQTINLETDLRMPDTMAQILPRTKAAPTTFKEPSTIQTINLETDLRMPDTMAQILPRTKAAPTTFKEPVDIPVFDVDAMFKRPTYEQILSETKMKAVSKVSTKQRSRSKTTFIPRSRTFNVVGSAYGQIPDTKNDLVAGIGIPSVPIPKTRTSTMFDSFVGTEPITETEAVLYKPPPKARVVFDYPPIKPIVVIPERKDKKSEKEKRKQKLKGFQEFIENPISSPFGNSVGKVNK